MTDPMTAGEAARNKWAYMWVGFLLGVVLTRLHLLDFLWLEFTR